MILYVLIGLALASFVVAFFSARTWHWGYVIVVELVFLSTLGFFLLASEVVRINAVIGKQIKTDQAALDKVDAQNDALKNGTNNSSIIGQLTKLDPPVKTSNNAEGEEQLRSIAELDHELLIWTRERGRIWTAKPVGVPNPQTGAVAVPTPAGIKPQTVVYLFEDGPVQPPAATGPRRGPQYLGEFAVTQVGPQQTTLTPALPLDDLERKRLAASRGPWIIYESMPIDRHEIFANKTDEQVKALQSKLPKKSVSEYIRDGKPATADDDPVHVVGYDETGKPLPPGDLSKATKKLFQRRLHDYAAEFDELVRRRILMLTDIDAVKKDIVRLTEAQDAAKKLQAFRENERTKLTSDLAGIDKERAAIQKHLDGVNKLLDRARTLTAELMKRNDQLAAQLAARQSAPAQQPNGSAAPKKGNASLVLGNVQ
jgi:hypothetical protein